MRGELLRGGRGEGERRGESMGRYEGEEKCRPWRVVTQGGGCDKRHGGITESRRRGAEEQVPFQHEGERDEVG